MAKVLIGWELGANRGHLTRMMRYAAPLQAAGHEVVIASQRIDGLAGDGFDGRVWQAPLWPRLLAWTATTRVAVPQTMGDILARLGLDQPGMLAALIGGWEAILSAERPDMVVAEYAPALLRAAAGRVPTVATGVGFDLPPADMDGFPSLSGRPASVDESGLLTVVNGDLARMGRDAITTLPAMFAADRALPTGLDALDPYWAWRPDGLGAPLLDDAPAPPLAPEGEEVFVYWYERGPVAPELWKALKISGLPVRVHVPRLDGDIAMALHEAGFAVERQPLPFATIARRSRLLLSHGGGGFVTSGLMAGRPQVIVHHDLEKRNNGVAVDRLRLGAQMPLGDLRAEPFASGLRALYAMDDLQERALTAAAGLCDGAGVDSVAEMVRLADRL
jgi:hypothetical protein